MKYGEEIIRTKERNSGSSTDSSSDNDLLRKASS